MSMIPASSADVQIAEITSATELIPDSPDSQVQQSSPAPYEPTVRPGEQGALAPMPQRANLADVRATVLQPVHRLFRPFKTTVTMPTLAVPAPPTTSAGDLLLWFQQLDELFQLVPDFSFMKQNPYLGSSHTCFPHGPLVEMKKLNLHDNDLGDDGASHISTCLSKIEKLNIGRCEISASGIKSISDAISKLPEPVKRVNVDLSLYDSSCIKYEPSTTLFDCCLTAFNVTMFDSLIDCRPGSPNFYLYASILSTMGPDVFYFNAVVLK
ncbi:unnamed protein product [Clavelina lepadiformis]|uniref:Uncharacterized protein n=1 Tax=Clavelina lepadiformis TaxID=159417 RepID=A0ABP0G9R1_CLALP